MDETSANQLIELNRRFYSQFGEAFSITRQRVQDGVRRMLAALPDEGEWLDLGCGNGSLALEWLASGRNSAYTGLDFSAELLGAARRALVGWYSQAGDPSADRPGEIRFNQADLSDSNWPAALPPTALRGALAFAVFHHIPSAALRIRILRQVHDLLTPGGLFAHSEWQFQHSPKLLARRQPWSRVGLSQADLEPGDTLLDWRFALPGQPEQTGLRYVHLFEREELAGLAAASQFEIVDEFEADGRGGRLGLYQLWRRA